MKLIDQFPIYEIGGVLRHLKNNCDLDSPNALDQLFALWSARKQLEPLIGGDPIPLNYCQGTAEDLVEFIRGYEHRLAPSLDPAESSTPIERWELRRLKEKIEIFEHQFSAELKKTATYAVPERGIFNTEQLVDRADVHTHDSVRSLVPEFALNEFRLAGRSLAFGLYSASGFHSARAVENMLRAYYADFIGEPGDIGLGLMASHLGQLREKKDKPTRLPNENTVRHLRDFADYDRNPLMHKTVDLEEIDATTLFNGALGVIVEMAKEMRDEDKQEKLPLSSGLIANALAKPKAAQRRKRPKKLAARQD